MHSKKFSPNSVRVAKGLLILVVIAIIGLTGWRVFSDKAKNEAALRQGASSAYIAWEFDGEIWKPNSQPPACESPLSISAPMDVTKATGVLMPGQIRGTDFKPHGGMAQDDSLDNSVTISAVRDAYLYRGARYTVSGETQYLFDFIDPCGIMYRFDHLNTLTGELAKYGEGLPAGGEDDTRTEVFSEHPFFKKGTILATAIGIKKEHNPFFDLGVYDLRKPNDASKTDTYKTDQKRIEDKEQSFYALCWFDLLPEGERAIVDALPGRGGQSRGESDYC